MMRYLLFILLVLIIPNTAYSSSTDYDTNSDMMVIITKPGFTPEDAFLKIMMLKKYLGAIHGKAIAKWMYNSITKHNLTPNTVLAIGFIESGFRQSARGTKSDTGIMQVMPFWAREELCQDLRLWHAQDNIECGCRILRYYIDEFDGHEISGIVAYNQGSRAVHRHKRRGKKLRKNRYAKLILDVKGLLDDFDEERGKIANEFRNLTNYRCVSPVSNSVNVEDGSSDILNQPVQKAEECSGERTGMCPLRR